MGLLVGMRTFKRYTCAEVMWFDERSPNGDVVSTIQKDLIETIKEKK